MSFFHAPSAPVQYSRFTPQIYRSQAIALPGDGWQNRASPRPSRALQTRNTNIMSSPPRSSLRTNPWTTSISAFDQEEIHDERSVINDQIMSSPTKSSQTSVKRQDSAYTPYTIQPQSRYITPQHQLSTQVRTSRDQRRNQFLNKLRANRTARRDERLNDSFERMDWFKEKRELEQRYETQAAALLKQIEDSPDVYEAEEEQRMKEEMQLQYEAEAQHLARMHEMELVALAEEQQYQFEELLVSQGSSTDPKRNQAWQQRADASELHNFPTLQEEEQSNWQAEIVRQRIEEQSNHDSIDEEVQGQQLQKGDLHYSSDHPSKGSSSRKEMMYSTPLEAPATTSETAAFLPDTEEQNMRRSNLVGQARQLRRPNEDFMDDIDDAELFRVLNQEQDTAMS